MSRLAELSAGRAAGFRRRAHLRPTISLLSVTLPMFGSSWDLVTTCNWACNTTTNQENLHKAKPEDYKVYKPNYK